MKFPIIFIFFTGLIHACNKDNCPEVFKLPFKVVPIQQEYRVGDTITIVSKFHKCLPAYDLFVTREVGVFDMEGIRWDPSTKVYRIDSIGHNGNRAFSEFDFCFEYIKDTLSDYDLFQYSSSGIGLVGEYTYSSDTFNLSFKMVCRTKGTYFLENLSGLLLSRQDFPGRCRRNGFDAIVEMNNGIGNNFEFFEESSDSFWNTWYAQQQRDVFLKSGGYCFKVVK